MDLYLKGKTAIVTGASQGLGKAIAKALAIEGVIVFATARSQERLESFKEEVVFAGGVAPVIFTQDITAVDGPQNIANAALSVLGHVDILVNNAGQSRPVDVTGPEECWIESMTLDFDRPRQLTQLLLPHMMERKEGAILNLTSSYELRSINVSAVAKAGIAAWSKALSVQLGRYNIRVNCLQPGLIDTQNVRNIFSDAEQRKAFAEREIPLGDFGEPQDAANVAAFLVSPRAKYLTGIVVPVDGGFRRYAF